MEVERFREFIVLAKELNYHRAAEKLFVTQSSLSKHIVALEQHYGTHLFERDRSGVRLTADGEALLVFALRIWDDYEKSLGLFEQQGSRAEGGPLAVGGTLDDPSCQGVVARTIELAGALDEPIALRFPPCISPLPEIQADALRAGEVDVAVLQMSADMLDELPDAANFVFRPLYEAPLVAIVDERHALAQRAAMGGEDSPAGAIGLADLQGCKIVHVVGTRQTVGWRAIERQLREASVDYAERLTTAASAWDFFNIDPGDAVFLMTRLSAAMRAGAGHTRTVAFADPAPTIPYGALYLKERACPRLDALLDAVAQAFREVDVRVRV